MLLQKIEIKNFRLLTQVELFLERDATVIVGRNNSGKTSLTELFRRLLRETNPTFRLEDFSLSAHEQFWLAYKASEEGKNESEVRQILPAIEIRLTVNYPADSAQFGLLGECIIDLDSECSSAIVAIRYDLKDGNISSLFKDLPKVEQESNAEDQKTAFCKLIRERVPQLYSCNVFAIDPGDPQNVKSLEWATVRGVFGVGFINAQRGLDDVTNKERDVLGKVLEALLNNAMSESAAEKDREIAKELELAVKGIQTGIDTGFNQQLQALLPAFSLFGYPGFADPELRTETTLDVKRLLVNYTKVHYAGINGINLPEAYNGLGARNLIFILLKLLESFKAHTACSCPPCVHVIFIEEPEVHLHPQMQEVFIGQLGQIASEFSRTLNNGIPWPVQFVVTTHSSHVANKAPFDAMRYFLVKSHPHDKGLRSTEIKDLRKGLGNTPAETLEFLHKYMTLTRCDLLFADKAILIEGTSERLLLPEMIKKIDSQNQGDSKLGIQYLSIVEVGGAYAHLFFDLLKFLELPTLVITDLDSTQKNANGKYIACKVSSGERTSNACIRAWFATPGITPKELIAKSQSEKTDGILHLAFEIPESTDVPCGRSFEDAFILANYKLFDMAAPDEDAAWEKAHDEGKSDFALRYAIEQTEWIVPRYIAEGLRWLSLKRRLPLVNTTGSHIC